MNYDKILIDILTTKNNTINSNLIKKINNKYINIKNYLLNRFEFVESITESFNRIKYNIKIRPICPICGGPLKYYKGITYSKTCSSKCSKILGSQTYFNNTGYTTPMKKEEVKDKVKKFYKDNPNVIIDKNKKFKDTCLKRYNATAPAKNKEIQDKIKKTCLLKYDVDNVFKSKEIQDKIKKTCLSKYGSINPQSSKEIRLKISNILSSKEIRDKINNTKRINNTFNTSNDEEELFIFLKDNFKNVIRQYKSIVYPFCCDFYLPDYDLYIEYQGSWTHGGHPFNQEDENDLSILKLWESKDTDYYRNAIITWTQRDVNKRIIAIQNNLNWLEYFTDDFNYIIDDIKKYINEYKLEYDENELNKEFNYYKTHIGKLSSYSKYNSIVKYFQQSVFFKKEYELLKNPIIKYRLIENRKRYLEKNIFTINELLTGFKKSGLYYGYSHFNPLIFKWFIETFNIKTCYDPCGGWGHRLLGALSLDKYIYNDLSKTTYENVNKIIKYFNITNTITYNNDARTFIPQEEYEAIFTCPPYYNIEEYECKSFDSMNDYNDFINSLFNLFYNSNAKIFGLVIREDLLGDHNDFIDKKLFKTNNSNLIISNNKQYYEYLYIFKK